MGLEYYWQLLSKSWKFTLFGRRIAFGFWVNIVVDRVSEKKTLENGVGDKEKPYQYRPLTRSTDIRVLELHPGRLEDPLHGRLIHNPELSLRRWSMDYEALSYTWGPLAGDVKKPQKARGESRWLLDLGEGYSQIQPNLDAALRHLRFLDAPRTLWIDALCINQESLQEKRTQVAMMQEIYTRAEKVNIWLGDAKENTNMGMEVLRYLAQNNSFEKTPPWVEVPDPRFLDGFREILQRDWFNRMWVVQEAVVSQRAVMMCGIDSFEWTNNPILVRKFIRSIKYAAISPQWEQAGLSDVNPGKFLQLLNLQLQHIERREGLLYPSPMDILDLAFEMRHRKATDRRDKLFALVGMVERGEASFLVDYNMDVEEVFNRLLEAIEI